MQADDGIDETAGIEHTTNRPRGVVAAADRDSTSARLNIERVAQVTMGMFESSTGQMQAHDFHQHLI